jgi:hypothetical protein
MPRSTYTSPYHRYQGRKREDRFQDQWANGANHYNRFLVDGGNGSNEIVAVVPWVEIVAIAGVAFDGDVALA